LTGTGTSSGSLKIQRRRAIAELYKVCWVRGFLFITMFVKALILIVVVTGFPAIAGKQTRNTSLTDQRKRWSNHVVSRMEHNQAYSFEGLMLSAVRKFSWSDD
jgi:hypothetical protein